MTPTQIHEKCCSDLASIGNTIDAKDAEIRRLRSALQDLVDLQDRTPMDHEACYEAMKKSPDCQLWANAQDALAGGGKDPVARLREENKRLRELLVDLQNASEPTQGQDLVVQTKHAGHLSSVKKEVESFLSQQPE